MLKPWNFVDVLQILKKYYEALEINPNSATAFKKYFDIVKKEAVANMKIKWKNCLQ